MGQLEIKKNALTGIQTPYGEDPENFDWVPAEPRPWERVDQIPDQLLKELHNRDAFPAELNLYGWGQVSKRDLGKNAGLGFFPFWMAGNDRASVCIFSQNASGSWGLDSVEVLYFTGPGTFKRKEFLPESQSETDTSASQVLHGLDLNDATVLPGLVRRQLAALYPWSNEPVQNLTQHDARFPSIEGARFGYSFDGLFRGRGQVLAVKGLRRVSLNAGTTEQQAREAMARTPWTIQIGHGTLR